MRFALRSFGRRTAVYPAIVRRMECGLLSDCSERRTCKSLLRQWKKKIDAPNAMKFICCSFSIIQRLPQPLKITCNAKLQSATACLHHVSDQHREGANRILASAVTTISATPCCWCRHAAQMSQIVRGCLIEQLSLAPA